MRKYSYELYSRAVKILIRKWEETRNKKTATYILDNSCNKYSKDSYNWRWYHNVPGLAMFNKKNIIYKV